LQMKILKDVGFGTKPCKINLFHLQSFLLWTKIYEIYCHDIFL
jgi:hypothetical protein